MSNTRDNSGSISANKRKEKDTHPDIRGQATIGGVEYWVDGWMKENDRGKWYSLSFKPKQPVDAPAHRDVQQPAKRRTDDDLEIPF